MLLGLVRSDKVLVAHVPGWGWGAVGALAAAEAGAAGVVGCGVIKPAGEFIPSRQLQFFKIRSACQPDRRFCLCDWQYPARFRAANRVGLKVTFRCIRVFWPTLPTRAEGTRAGSKVHRV